MDTKTRRPTRLPKLTAAQRAEVRSLMEDGGESRASAVAWVRAFEGDPKPVLEATKARALVLDEEEAREMHAVWLAEDAAEAAESRALAEDDRDFDAWRDREDGR